MKIKFSSLKLLSLILIITGVLAGSGCVESQAQPIAYKYQGDLYRSIFYPYEGLFVNDGIPSDPHQPSAVPEGQDSLQNAALMLAGNIEKAEAISARLEPGVQYLRDQGKDVSRLESLIEEYNGLVDEAKYYLDLAVSSSDKEESPAGTNNGSAEGEVYTEKDYLIQSQKSMVQASLVLKDIFDEFKLLMPGNEELNETDRLNATGDGKVALMGSFDLKLHLEDGEIAVMSPDSVIKIEGDYVLEIKEGRPDDIFVYYIQSADLEISGPRKTLMLNGENITVEADGEGYASFFGNGTYSVENASGVQKEEQWAVDSFLNDMTSEKLEKPEKPENTESKIHSVGLHGLDTGIREPLLKKITF
jgi:hypothetical protein